MIRRSDPFGGDRARLAYDLGKAWAWCEHVHRDIGPFTLVAGVFDLGDGRFGVEPVLKKQSGISSAVSYVRRPSKRLARSAISKPR